MLICGLERFKKVKTLSFKDLKLSRGYPHKWKILPKMITLPKGSPGPYQEVDRALNPGTKIISVITSSDLMPSAFLF